VAESVKQALVVPGSGLVKRQAEAEGLHRVFLDAGFEWRDPGCSMCLAMNADRLEPGERRPFRGHPQGERLMEALTRHTGLVVPLDRANVDTDAIIPKQYLKSIERTGFGVNLFDDWRYLDPGEPGMDHSRRRPNPDFVLNQPRYQGASILLARENFGCGSSREHAPWALQDYGIRVIIAPSFADIFYNNCFKNGLLPIVLPAETVDRLFREVAAQEGYTLDGPPVPRGGGAGGVHPGGGRGGPDHHHPERRGDPFRISASPSSTPTRSAPTRRAGSRRPRGCSWT